MAKMDVNKLLSTIFCMCASSAADLVTPGVYFEELEFPNSNLMRETTSASYFETAFQQCYSENHCNFVVKDTTTGKLSTKQNEGDLPDDKSSFRIWKKVVPGM